MAETIYSTRFIEGDSAPLCLRASSTIDIAELQDMIKEERSILLQLEGVDAASLILMKVSSLCEH